MSLIESTLEQLRKERTAGMLKTAPFSVHTALQLDAVEDLLTQLLAAEALGDVTQAASHTMTPRVQLEAFDASEPYKQRLKRSAEPVRATLKALAGTQDVKKVPRR